MNNYLAKPVRVQTLKTLLETYLSQAPKPIDNLEKKGEQIVKEVLDDADGKRKEKENVVKKEEMGKVEEKQKTTGGMGPPIIVPERPALKEKDSASSERTVVPDDEE